MPWIRGAPHNAPNYGIGSNDGYRRQGRSGLGLPPVSEGLRRSRRIDPISRSAKLLRHQLGRLARSLQCQDAISPGDSLLISRGLWTLGQFASKTGKSAFAKTCWVAPPKIICLNRLCV
jgi:hypothetical protein